MQDNGDTPPLSPTAGQEGGERCAWHTFASSDPNGRETPTQFQSGAAPPSTGQDQPFSNPSELQMVVFQPTGNTPRAVCRQVSWGLIEGQAQRETEDVTSGTINEDPAVQLQQMQGYLMITDGSAEQQVVRRLSTFNRDFVFPALLRLIDYTGQTHLEVTNLVQYAINNQGQIQALAERMNCSFEDAYLAHQADRDSAFSAHARIDLLTSELNSQFEPFVRRQLNAHGISPNSIHQINRQIAALEEQLRDYGPSGADTSSLEVTMEEVIQRLQQIAKQTQKLVTNQESLKSQVAAWLRQIEQQTLIKLSQSMEQSRTFTSQTTRELKTQIEELTAQLAAIPTIGKLRTSCQSVTVDQMNNLKQGIASQQTKSKEFSFLYNELYGITSHLRSAVD